MENQFRLDISELEIKEVADARSAGLPQVRA